MFKSLSNFGAYSHLICVCIVFQNLQCALGKDCYSVPVYSLCSFLLGGLVNRSVPPISIFVLLLTELVSVLVNGSETLAPVNIINSTLHSLPWILVFIHCCLSWFYLCMSVSLLRFMTTWEKRGSPL